MREGGRREGGRKQADDGQTDRQTHGGVVLRVQTVAPSAVLQLTTKTENGANVFTTAVQSVPPSPNESFAPDTLNMAWVRCTHTGTQHPRCQFIAPLAPLTCTRVEIYPI